MASTPMTTPPTITTPDPAPGSPSTSTPGPGSISTEETIPVRKRVPQLLATRLLAPLVFETTAGERVTLHPGDWIIRRGGAAIDYARSPQLTAAYEVEEDGWRLSRALAARLERTIGYGSTRDPASLVDAVERLARITIGSILIEFTPGQLEEIAHRAAKRGHTVQQELQAAVDRVKDEIFHRG